MKKTCAPVEGTPWAAAKDDAASLLGHLLVGRQGCRSKIHGTQNVGFIKVNRCKNNVATETENVVTADDLLQRGSMTTPQLGAILLDAMLDQVLPFRPPVEMAILIQ